MKSIRFISQKGSVLLFVFVLLISMHDSDLLSPHSWSGTAIAADAAGTGLKGEYYDNMDLSGLKLTRTDANVDFEWGTGSPAASIGSDTFSVRWTGTIKPNYSETYTFYLNADDGVRLWVDGQLLLNRWVNQAGQFSSGSIPLIAGQNYEIQIEYFENLSGAAVGLLWQSSSQAKEFVPQSQLYPPAELPGVGVHGEYFNNMELTGARLERTDAVIQLAWGTDAPDTSLSSDQFSVRWTGTIKPKYSETYTFYAWVDDGVRLWVDGQLLLDSWLNQSGVFTSLSIPLIANQRYDIKMEYFENEGGAAAGLSWSSASQTKQVVPQTQLYLPYQSYMPTEYHYNAGGRLEYIRSSDGHIIQYEYDVNGNLIRTSTK